MNFVGSEGCGKDMEALVEEVEELGLEDLGKIKAFCIWVSFWSYNFAKETT